MAIYGTETGDVPCGNNGNVSLNVTSTYFAYICGMYEGQAQRATSGSVKVKAKLSYPLWAFILCLAMLTNLIEVD